MIAFVRRKLDEIRGSGEAAVTVPSMDGALKPNRLLEDAAVLREAPRPDQIVERGGDVLYSSGTGIFDLSGAEKYRFDAQVSALAAAPGGALAVGLADGTVRIIGGPHDGALPKMTCPVALVFDGPDTLYIANGSETFGSADWKHDLMIRGATGSVHRVDLSTGKGERLMDRLAWPYGLGLSPKGLVVAESWRHRLRLRTPEGQVRTVLSDLPAYPARLSPAASGGWWLALFAPRNPLIEFILREPDFRDRMMEEIDPDHWAAPSLVKDDTYMRPLQGGAQKHLGVVKPWAPSQSYGLVVRLDADFRPRSSQHSRADGRRHGITSVIETGGRVIAASKGGDLILELAGQGGRA